MKADINNKLMSCTHTKATSWFTWTLVSHGYHKERL
jgi:hypothetical protein